MSSKIREAKLSELIPDDKNMNKHNQYGMSLLEKSISTLGLGRSILVDKNNRIIGGNGVTESAANLGLEDCIIIETKGDQLVVVKRTDIDLDSAEGRSLAMADNAIAHINLDWDLEAIEEIKAEWDLNPEDWGVKDFETDYNETDYSEKNKEIDVDDMSSEMTMKFSFSELEFIFVRNALEGFGDSAEEAILKILNYEG